MSLTRAALLLKKAQQRMLARNELNACDVLIRYVATAPDTGYDPNLETSAPSAHAVEHSVIMKAFVHTVNINTSGYVKNQQVRHGDIILDFPGEADFFGMSKVRFEIGDQTYVQKDAGGELLESWDVRCGGVAITRSFLVTLI